MSASSSLGQVVPDTHQAVETGGDVVFQLDGDEDKHAVVQTEGDVSIHSSSSSSDASFHARKPTR